MEDVLDFIRPAKLLPGSAGCKHSSGYRGAGENKAGKAPAPMEVTVSWGGASSRLEGEKCQGPAKLSACHVVSQRECEPYPITGCEWSGRCQEGRLGRGPYQSLEHSPCRPWPHFHASPSKFQPEGGLRFPQPASLRDTSFATGVTLPHLSP